jgi:8-oxo-dGTP pyrophosphatase MutT (NUDIX family)
MSTHKSWKKLGQKTVYKGRVHIVEHSVELPNGELSTYEVDHAAIGAAAVLIKTAANEIVLTHQFRFPLDRWIYDLPGGGIHAEETPEEAAIRECREEVHITPQKLIKLAVFYPNPGRSDWPANIFYCENFVESNHEFNDPSETVERVHMPVAQFQKLVDEQAIVDPGLLIAWYTARDKGYIVM